MHSIGSVAVVGGGVIGLSVARRAALDGWTVRVHRTDDHGAWWVAAGMLAPHSEGWPGEERLLAIGPGVAEVVARRVSRRTARRGGRPRRDRWWSPSTAPTPPT